MQSGLNFTKHIALAIRRSCLSVLMITAPAALSTLMPVTGIAQTMTANDKLAGLEATLTPHLQERTKLNEARKSLQQEEDNIDFGVAAYKKSLAQYKSQLEAFNMDVEAANQSDANLRADLSTHNARQCRYSANNPGACAAYDAEAARLNQRGANLSKQIADLQNTYKYLSDVEAKNNELRKLISENTEKWSAKVKKFNEANEANEAAINRIQAQIASYKLALQDCLKSLPQGTTREKMSELCGQMFDGNSVHKDAQLNDPDPRIRRIGEADLILSK